MPARDHAPVHKATLRRNRLSKPPASVFDQLRSAWEKLALVSALFYALGYVARAIHAWDYNFGALPGARFDYLMAGLFLSIPVAALAAVLLGARRAMKRLNLWADAHRVAARRWQERVLYPLILLAVAGLAAHDSLTFLSPDLRRHTTTAAMIVFVVAAVLSAVLSPTDRALPRSASMAGWLGQGFGIIAAGYVALLLVLVFIVAALFGAQFLGKWPQELGGVKPKCGVLDLAVEKLSPELAGLLVPGADGAASAAKVARSHRLEVFSTTGPWLIRTTASSTGTGPRRSIRLPDEAVLAVEWVAGATPLPEGSRSCPTP